MLIFNKLLKAHYNNVVTVLRFNFKGRKKLKLQGLKVNAFYQNLTGNYEAVTIDIWMLRYFNYDKVYLTVNPYKNFTRIIKRLAEKEGLKPCQMQAVLWTK